MSYTHLTDKYLSPVPDNERGAAECDDVDEDLTDVVPQQPAASKFLSIEEWDNICASAGMIVGNIY